MLSDFHGMPNSGNISFFITSPWLYVFFLFLTECEYTSMYSAYTNAEVFLYMYVLDWSKKLQKFYFIENDFEIQLRDLKSKLMFLIN